MTASQDHLVQQIADQLVAQAASLSVAESCTGGGVAQALTAVAGSSAWFGYGFVTYANSAKIALLGVDEATLTQFGAVSEQVAVQMAEGARARASSTWALATTGIAGPSGGSAEKPVGTVWFAWAGPRGTHSRRCVFAGDRASIREQAVVVALTELTKLIKFTV
ncbi:CinA family protein [Simiduia curdlanivorans]|uniref:CinA family protein n=1 Tax=Simiduia curdlanivorans TaxID=1492769 RepID=A0ABV8V4N4_9GAMM|nr:CinA family protein [Simiduia curdlanivorans]MDN3639280.1 CinA family protein [Simiduia curdlanivorans]